MRVTRNAPALVGGNWGIGEHIDHLYNVLSNGNSPCIITNQQPEQWTYIENTNGIIVL